MLWQFLFCPLSDFNSFFPDVFFFIFILRLFLLRLFSLLFYFSERIRNSSYQKQEIKQGLGWIHCQNKTICSWGFYSEDLVPGPFPSSCVCFMWFRQSLLWVSLPLFIWENMAVYSRTCLVCTRCAFASLSFSLHFIWDSISKLMWLLSDFSSGRHVAYEREKCIISTGLEQIAFTFLHPSTLKTRKVQLVNMACRRITFMTAVSNVPIFIQNLFVRGLW